MIAFVDDAVHTHIVAQFVQFMIGRTQDGVEGNLLLADQQTGISFPFDVVGIGLYGRYLRPDSSQTGGEDGEVVVEAALLILGDDVE